MATLKELRGRARELRVPRFSVLKKAELVEAIAEVEKEAYYKSITCDQCLREQQKQKIIDEHTYNKKVVENVIRQLVCDHCKHEDFAVDGDLQICMQCGAVYESVEGDYCSHRKIHK